MSSHTGRSLTFSVAISLTLCSLASALQPIPGDCVVWRGDEGVGRLDTDSSWRFWRPSKGDARGSARTACLA